MTLPDNLTPMPTTRRPRRPRRRVACLAMALASVLATLGAGACGGASLRNPFDESRGGSSSQIRIHIENRNFSDVRVYAVANAGDHPLGVVGGNQSENFKLEWRQLAALYFRLDFLAGQSYRTQAVNVGPGNQVELEIPSTPTNFILRVR